ncbi:MAG: peptide ABC transporter ATP-binding protein [Chloroflexi bacterium RBG_16_57_11]|nr:MAG: peptide ABC transporter ATP-binding protein [Chloroflexi bacterium RBG_16_57_11]
MAALLSVSDLHVSFQTYAGKVYAVNGMTFDIQPGEIFGLVGESGCGKSVTSLAILRILPGHGRITRGEIAFDGRDLTQLSEREMQPIRGRQIAMIFQDPSTSLNPVFSVGNQITRIIRHHMGYSSQAANQRALELFSKVALPDPKRIFTTYPHELSGGMQQRVMIALALASGARLLIADEPTTALDVTIQDQILELLVELRQREGLSILLITHNLGVVAETCDKVGVAYAGKIVEIGPTSWVLHQRQHPYTEGLLAALPSPRQKGQDLLSIPGSVPDGLSVIPGCPFHLRCPHVMEVCRHSEPGMAAAAGSVDDQHRVSCYLYSSEVVR